MGTLLVCHARLLVTMDAECDEMADDALLARDKVIKRVCATDELPLGPTPSSTLLTRSFYQG